MTKQMDSIEWLKAIPAKNAARIFLIDEIQGGKTLTFGQMNDWAAAIGADLRSRGLAKGDRVAILLDNSAAFCALYFGCLYAGLVVVPVNPILPPDEISFILSDSRSKAVVTSDAFSSKIDPARLPDVKLIRIEELGQKPATGFTPYAGMDSQDDLAIVYTSGTTAK